MAAKRISMDRIRGVVNMGREAEENMGEKLHLAVYVDGACADWLACAVRDALMPERDALVDVSLINGAVAVEGIDVGIVLSGGSDEAVRTVIRCFAGARQQVVVVAESSLDVPETNLPSKLDQFISEVVASEPAQLCDRLANVLLDATDKDVSLAANFKFCRSVATARLVSRCAARNAFMGIADFIPGAGMPLMTMNEVNLSFDIAATYGHGLSIGRVPEVALVMCAGFAYRWVARIAMRLLPGLSFVLRPGLAYAGTLVTGRMLASHFSDRALPAEPGVTIDATVEPLDEEQPVRGGVDETDAQPRERAYITIANGSSVA